MNKGFYIHVNTVLDTRAGAIRRIDSEKHAELLRTGYHKRKGDFFKGIDPEAFKAVYRAWEVETLIESTLTNIFSFLYPQVIDMMKELISQELPAHEQPQLDVNIWPYDLGDEERAMLRSIVYFYMRGIIGVNVINVDPKELRPGICYEQYAMMAMYEYDDWLNAHSDELIRSPVPFLTLVAPMVYFNHDPDTHHETIDALKNGINSLALLEASIAPRIALKFVNIDVFSIVYPDDRLAQVEEDSNASFRTIEELDKDLLNQKERNPPKPD